MHQQPKHSGGWHIKLSNGRGLISLKVPSSLYGNGRWRRRV